MTRIVRNTLAALFLSIFVAGSASAMHKAPPTLQLPSGANVLASVEDIQFLHRRIMAKGLKARAPLGEEEYMLRHWGDTQWCEGISLEAREHFITLVANCRLPYDLEGRTFWISNPVSAGINIYGSFDWSSSGKTVVYDGGEHLHPRLGAVRNIIKSTLREIIENERAWERQAQ